jgi:hypothetical protein
LSLLAATSDGHDWCPPPSSAPPLRPIALQQRSPDEPSPEYIPTGPSRRRQKRRTTSRVLSPLLVTKPHALPLVIQKRTQAPQPAAAEASLIAEVVDHVQAAVVEEKEAASRPLPVTKEEEEEEEDVAPPRRLVIAQSVMEDTEEEPAKFWEVLNTIEERMLRGRDIEVDDMAKVVWCKSCNTSFGNLGDLLEHCWREH